MLQFPEKKSQKRFGFLLFLSSYFSTRVQIPGVNLKTVSIEYKTSCEHALISIEGLGETFETGMNLLHKIISGATISEEALKNIKIDLFKSRINALSP